MLVAYVAKIGHRTATLCKAEALLSELKAIDASIIVILNLYLILNLRKVRNFLFLVYRQLFTFALLKTTGQPRSLF